MKRIEILILSALCVFIFILGSFFGKLTNQQDQIQRCLNIRKNHELPITYTQIELEIIIFGEVKQ